MSQSAGGASPVSYSFTPDLEKASSMSVSICVQSLAVTLEYGDIIIVEGLERFLFLLVGILLRLALILSEIVGFETGKEIK
ncbi:hypothetical protein PFISCL1PPCAC_19791 [Pristionchus fissidentatus]|uniref:Uncharacterized protein n=1 Tax=Pristionchus fissidentatus TaxID=1538716 RepID=A0AAV5WFA3_9BILA|nr:hypothetical protein PFISCL1PPCAC_19791 [Pristionchus fissidentatus]